MSDEIPAVEIDGDTWVACLRPPTNNSRRMTLADLCALVSALPDEMKLRVYAELDASGAEAVGLFIKLQSERDDALTELSAVKAERDELRGRLDRADEDLERYDPSRNGS